MRNTGLLIINKSEIHSDSYYEKSMLYCHRLLIVKHMGIKHALLRSSTTCHNINTMRSAHTRKWSCGLTWCSSAVSPQVLWPYWSRSLTWSSLWWAPWAAALWPSSSLPCFRSSPSIMKTWSCGWWSRTSASVSLALWALWRGRTSPSRRLWHGTAADTTAHTFSCCERWQSDRINVGRTDPLNHLLTTCSFDFCWIPLGVPLTERP